ncbi:hypothetical protein [Pararhodobacter oceanensis]|uniref:hypothetical protein n=1 Tax=Pararhodobacter oceanensis TaxID=2172121 RepID=UPI003A9461F2
MADAQFSALAMQRMKATGHVWHWPPSGVGVSQQDAFKAADILLNEAKEDAVSHLAALHLFEHLVSKQHPIPSLLLKYVADALVGNIQAPKLNSKY